MSIWRIITSNYIINVGFVSFFLAQLIKTILTLIITRELNLERLVGAGGMPSAHSAMTAAIAIGIARKLGYTAPEFGIALAFAAIVMYDAMGVRRAAGEQAKVLNKMIFEVSNFPFFLKPGGPKSNAPAEVDAAEQSPAVSQAETDPEEEKPFIDKELKEYLGHTPFEVLGGCLLGILVAIFMRVI